MRDENVSPDDGVGRPFSSAEKVIKAAYEYVAGTGESVA